MLNILCATPGLPIFFNVAREKLGRPGHDAVWDAVSLLRLLACANVICCSASTEMLATVIWWQASSGGDGWGEARDGGDGLGEARKGGDGRGEE